MSGPVHGSHRYTDTQTLGSPPVMLPVLPVSQKRLETGQNICVTVNLNNPPVQQHLYCATHINYPSKTTPLVRACVCAGGTHEPTAPRHHTVGYTTQYNVHKSSGVTTPLMTSCDVTSTSPPYMWCEGTALRPPRNGMKHSLESCVAWRCVATLQWAQQQESNPQSLSDKCTH